MLRTWFISFLGGVLFSSQFDLIRYNQFLSILCLVVLIWFVLIVGGKRRKMSLFVLAEVAFLWGAIHNPKSMQLSIEDGFAKAKLIQNRPLLFKSSKVLILSENQIGVSKCHANSGEDLLCKPSNRQEGIFSPQCFCRSADGLDPVPDKLEYLADLLRNKIESSFAKQNSFLSPWLRSLFIGDVSGLGQDVLLAFKRLGMFHLLVVSGFHLSFVCLFVESTSKFLFHLLYALRMINVRHLMVLKQFFGVFLGIALLIYAYVVGMGPAVQRAYFAFIVSSLSKFFAIGGAPIQRVYLVFCLQSLCFPIGYINISNALSWYGYLTIFAMGQLSGKPGGWVEVLLGQMSLLFFCAALFSEISFVGLLTNLILSPLFVMVYGLAFVLLFNSWVPRWVLEVCEEVQLLFIKLMVFVDKDIVSKVDGLYLNTLSNSFRAALFFVALIYVLNIFHKLSIESHRKKYV